MKRISYRCPRLLFALMLFAQLGTTPVSGQVTPAVPLPPAQGAIAPDTNVYLVTFRQGTPAADRLASVQSSGVVLRRTFASANAMSVEIPAAAALARLRNDPRVLTVVQNRTITLAVPAATAQRNGRGGGGGDGGGGGGGGGGAPKAPTGLQASAASPTEIVLLWNDKARNEDGFGIERCTGTGCVDFSEIAQVGADTTGYSNSGLTADTVYSYRVMAFNASGSSTYSNTAEASTDPAPPPPATPPAAPGNLTATSDSTGILVEWWDNSVDETGFELDRCLGAALDCTDPGFVQIAQLGPDVTSHTDSGLAGATYTYRVRAFNGAGVSAYSNIDDAIEPEPTGDPQTIPTGVLRIGAAPGMVTRTGAGVGVAVVDTGLDFNHPDLALDPEVLNPEMPGLNAFSAFYPTCQDFYGHGTHVGGIIAARDNAIDVVGVAPDSTLYCVNVFYDDPVEGVIADDESLIAGLDWIAMYADSVTPPIRVVNMSLGRPWTTDDDDPDHALHVVVRALYDSGIAIAVAAGNDPLSEATQQVPAGYEEVLAAASTTSITGLNGYDDFFGPCPGLAPLGADTASFFTTDGAFVGGRGVTVSAPGAQREDIFDFDGDCYLEAVGILSTALNGGTEQLYGTSMASPHLAGVLALMWEAEQSLGLPLGPEDARNRIRSGVDRPGTAPLDSPIVEYSFDGEREGVLWAPAALWEAPPPDADLPPDLSIIAPLSGATYDAGATVDFEGTAIDPEQGDISGVIVWTSSIDGQIGTGGSFSTTLSTGNHAITATVADAGGNNATANTSITVGSPSQSTTVNIASIVYTENGNNLSVTIGLADEFGNPVQGALVSADLIEWFYTLMSWPFSGTTDNQGNVQFQLISAPIGCYLVEVQSIDAGGLSWSGVTPTNYYCK